MGLFSKIFSKEDPTPAKPVVHGINDRAFYGLELGGRVTVDALPFRLLEDKTLIPPPIANQAIPAVGVIDLGDDMKLYRYYIDEDAFIQVLSSNGVADELRFFAYVGTINPDNANAFRAFVSQGSRLGAPTFDFEGKTFARVWGEDPSRWAPPVVLDEKVTKATSSHDLTLYTMLYEREIPGEDRKEFLLVTAEDSGPDEFVVSIAAGVEITSADLDVV